MAQGPKECQDNQGEGEEAPVSFTVEDLKHPTFSLFAGWHLPLRIGTYVPNAARVPRSHPQCNLTPSPLKRHAAFRRYKEKSRWKKKLKKNRDGKRMLQNSFPHTVNRWLSSFAQLRGNVISRPVLVLLPHLHRNHLSQRSGGGALHLRCQFHPCRFWA